VGDTPTRDTQHEKAIDRGSLPTVKKIAFGSKGDVRHREQREWGQAQKRLVWGAAQRAVVKQCLPNRRVTRWRPEALKFANKTESMGRGREKG